MACASFTANYGKIARYVYSCLSNTWHAGFLKIVSYNNGEHDIFQLHYSTALLNCTMHACMSYICTHQLQHTIIIIAIPYTYGVAVYSCMAAYSCMAVYPCIPLPSYATQLLISVDTPPRQLFHELVLDLLHCFIHKKQVFRMHYMFNR